MYDLIIIGGGPSGSAAGRIAGQMGLETLLIEKEVFPRYKPCGGAFSEQAMSYLDFKVPEHIHERNIYGVRTHFGRHVIEKHKPYRIATLVTRSILDSYLIEKAKETGIEIIMGEKVINFEEHRNYVKVYTNNSLYKARYVIVAEGSSGALKYRIRRKDQKGEFGICVVTEIEKENQVFDKYTNNLINIHFGISKGGIGWIFPHEKYFSVGIGGLAKHLPDPKTMMKDFLIANGFNGDYKLKWSIIPAGGIKRKIISSRVVLCGDAAGFVDPFYGEGIAYAIRSGQLAAEILAKIISGKNGLETIKDYPLRCEYEFGNNLKYSFVLSRLIHLFPSLIFKLFTRGEGVIDQYLELPAIKKSSKSFLLWLIPLFKVSSFASAILRKLS
jgi:geranylgeranyl reductase family protein